MLDWIAIAVAVWLISGLLPGLMQMFERARQTYYVDPMAPARGALMGPFCLWNYVMTTRRER